MTNKLFNTTFENSLRVLILLEAFKDEQNLDMIYATDFMVTYAASFGIDGSDLNGENQFKFSEFASRREIVSNALKQLVLDGLVIPKNTQDGILYRITDEGKRFSQSLNSDYSKEYRATAQKVIKSIAPKTERQIIDYINQLSAESLRKGVRI